MDNMEKKKSIFAATHCTEPASNLQQIINKTPR